MSEQKIPYDDIIAIIGELYLSSHLRIRSLQQQAAPLYESFQKQTEILRAENAELKQKLATAVLPDGDSPRSLP